MEQYIARKLLFTGASFVRVYIHCSPYFDLMLYKVLSLLCELGLK